MLLLEILKWIGIVLLYLLLLVIVVLLLVLFLPIKYSGEGTYNEEKQYALLKARWFWGLIRVKASFPQQPYLSVKLLWIELLKPKEEPVAEAAQVIKEPVKEPEHMTEVKKEPVKPEKSPVKESSSDGKKSAESAARDTAQVEVEKESVFKKMSDIKEKVVYYISIFQEQDTKDLLAHCKKRIFKILKSIRPRRVAFRGTVGFASPDTTGYLYGGYCMLSSYLGKNIILTPDFDREIIDVSGCLKGHITVFVLAWNALRIYLDKRLMRLIAKLKKGGR